MKDNLICSTCGNNLDSINKPNEWQFSIPFTRIEIKVWHWVTEPYCLYCATPEQDYYDIEMEDAYNQGCQDGYEEALGNIYENTELLNSK